MSGRLREVSRGDVVNIGRHISFCQLLLTHEREDEDTEWSWAGGSARGPRSRCRLEANARGTGGGAGGERLRRGMVLGPDRRGVGRQQAGRAQEARQAGQGQVPRRDTEEKGQGRMMLTRFK